MSSNITLPLLQQYAQKAQKKIEICDGCLRYISQLEQIYKTQFQEIERQIQKKRLKLEKKLQTTTIKLKSLENKNVIGNWSSVAGIRQTVTKIKIEGIVFFIRNWPIISGLLVLPRLRSRANEASRIHAATQAVLRNSNRYPGLASKNQQELIRSRANEASRIHAATQAVLRNSNRCPGLASKNRQELIGIFKQAIQRDLLIQNGVNQYWIEYDSSKMKFNVCRIDEKAFAKGGRGEVRKVYDCFYNSIEVLKQAIASKGHKANVTVENEYWMLRSLHSPKTWGLQAPPRKLIQINAPSEPKQSGYLGVLYDSDYSKNLKKNPRNSVEECLIDMHQLMYGLKTLHEQDILHGDIKPQNILVKKDADGMLLVHLADIGEAVKADAKVSLVDLLGYGGKRGHTRAYSPLDDLNLSKAFYEAGNRDDLIDVEKQRDVFAIGSILYKLLQGQRPFSYDQHGCPKVHEDYKQIHRLPVSKALQQLVQSMLAASYKARPTAERAFAEFSRLLETEYPRIALQIKTKLQREYPGNLIV